MQNDNAWGTDWAGRRMLYCLDQCQHLTVRLQVTCDSDSPLVRTDRRLMTVYLDPLWISMSALRLQTRINLILHFIASHGRTAGVGSRELGEINNKIKKQGIEKKIRIARYNSTIHWLAEKTGEIGQKERLHLALTTGRRFWLSGSPLSGRTNGELTD